MATVTVQINANGAANPPNRHALTGDTVEFSTASRSVVLCFTPGVFPETRYVVCRNDMLPITVVGSTRHYPYSITLCPQGGCDCAATNPAPCDPTLLAEDVPPEMIID